MTRQQDTRHKIQLGGLVIKAGLRDAPPAVILGMLVLGARALSGPRSAEFRERCERAGDAAFAESANTRAADAQRVG